MEDTRITPPQQPKQVMDIKPATQETNSLPSGNVPVAQAPMAADEPSADEHISLQSNGEQPKSPAPKKRSAALKVGAILLVSGALATASVVYYFQSNQQTETLQTAADTTTVAPASEQIEATNADIDEALKDLDAESDFNETELSDQTLDL